MVQEEITVCRRPLQPFGRTGFRDSGTSSVTGRSRRQCRFARAQRSGWVSVMRSLFDGGGRSGRRAARHSWVRSLCREISRGPGCRPTRQRNAGKASRYGEVVCGTAGWMRIDCSG
jgi:hypothetical protein